MTNLAALLFDTARRQPQLPAVSDPTHSWSYREFARRAAAVAAGLRAHGLGPGDRVMLCMENCAEFLELLFACWTAGLVAVPVNARLHPREVEYIAADSEARLVVVTPELAAALALASLPPVFATGGADYRRLAAHGELHPAAGEPSDMAWLFYTSGTTGRPKGAMLTHRNLLLMSHCYYADIDPIDASDTCLCPGPLSHGAGLYALPFLLKGARISVLPYFDVAAILV